MRKWLSLKVAMPMTLLFLAVVGFIYTGICTPTEASARSAPLGAAAISPLSCAS